MTSFSLTAVVFCLWTIGSSAAFIISSSPTHRHYRRVCTAVAAAAADHDSNDDTTATSLTSSPSHSFGNRRSFLFKCTTSIIFAPTAAMMTTATTLATTAHADEPMNIYYKSKADEDEDPLAVFGRSLSTISQPTTTTETNFIVNDQDTFKTEESERSTTTTTTQAPHPADLSRALQEKQQSQKRRIDPRTHG